jgi:hypothetical protein
MTPCLKGVEEMGEGKYRQGEGVQVPGLDEDLVLQQDQGQHLRTDNIKIILEGNLKII